jgi:hypothetical protein
MSKSEKIMNEILKRAEELRKERPDKNRKWNSLINSGQVRSVVEAIAERLAKLEEK